MSTFQTDFTAAKTVVIKAFEHDYTPHIRALLQVLVEYLQLNVLEPARHWERLFELVSEILQKEPFPYLLTVFFKIHFLAIYIVKKTFDNFMLGITTAYASVWNGMSYVLDTPEKTNIAVNVIALNVLVFFSLWLMSLVFGTLFGKRVHDREEIEPSAKKSKSTSGKGLHSSDETAEREGEDETPEKAKNVEDIHAKVAKKTAK